MEVNKKLLPIKGHFFFFNAGTAPLVPYLSTYARQLGFSSTTVGLIYTVLPIFGLIAKPVFGVIADRFKIQKRLLIIIQILTIISFSAIYFIPGSKRHVTVELDCGDGVTELRSCFRSKDLIDTCKINTLGKNKEVSLCNMNCDMSSPKMWETVCEHWHLPQYCYSNTDSIKFSSEVNNITLRANETKCAYLNSGTVTLDGYKYDPHCRLGSGFVDINQPCDLSCTNKDLSKAIGKHKANITCVNGNLNFRLCPNETDTFTSIANTALNSTCDTTCQLDKTAPWRLMEICEGLGADVAETCQPKTNHDVGLPLNLSFVGTIYPWTAITEQSCVYIQLNHIMTPNGTTHYPNCVGKAQYQMETELFHTACDISCNNSLVNEIFQEASNSMTKDDSQFSLQFWLFFLFMILSWVGQTLVVTFADAICYNLLGAKSSLYGKQRLWGSVGWGVFAFSTGALIDLYSDGGAYKNYAVAFMLMFVFLTSDVIVSCFLQIDSTKMSMNILADVGSVLSSLPTFVFLLWTIVVGLCTGLLWQFLFWHVEDVAKVACEGTEHVKTLQGLISAVQTFFGEIPFMFLSGFLLKRLGHVNMMSLVLFAFGFRFVLYSFLTNAWWVLPIEMLQGITFGMFYPTMTSYANVVSPPGTETTVQGLTGAVFEGLGTAVGSFLGGQLYGRYGGGTTFRWFGCGAIACCLLHVGFHRLVRDKNDHTTQGYSSVIRYEQPSDMVYIMEDMSGGR